MRLPGSRLVLALTIALAISASRSHAAAPAASASPAPAPDSASARPGTPECSESLRRLWDAFGSSRAAEAEAGASALLASLGTPATRWDSLCAAEALDVFVQAELRQSKFRAPELEARATQAVAIKRRMPAPDPRGLALSTEQLAIVLKNLGKLDEAVAAYDTALAILDGVPRADPLDVARVRTNLANVLVVLGRFGEAEPQLAQALTAEEKSGGSEGDVALTLTNLAFVMTVEGRTGEAEPRFARALAMSEKLWGPDDPNVALVCHDYGLLFGVTGDYARAAGLLERALTIRERVEPGSRDVALTLKELGKLSIKRGDVTEAKQRLERAEPILLREFGPDHPDVGDAFSALATAMQKSGEYDSARTLYTRALGIFQRSNGQLAQASCELGLATVLMRSSMEMNDFEHARTLVQHAIEVRTRLLGNDHVDVAQALLVRADLERETADYAASGEDGERARALIEAKLGADHPLAAEALVGLATLALTTGDYARSRTLYERALAVLEKALGPDHAEVAGVLNNLALLLKNIGDYPGALRLYERALGILERRLGHRHTDVANVLNNMGLVDRARGDRAAAKEQFNAAAEIWKAILPENHPDLATVFHNLGTLANEDGDFFTSEALFEKAIKIREAAFGPNHLETALSLNGLANSAKGRGEYEDAEQLYQRVLGIYERSFGTGHPASTIVLHNLAGAELETGHLKEALDDALRVEALSREHLRLTSRALTEREALHYAATRPRGIDLVLTCAGRDLDPASLAKAWDCEIRSRALVLDEMATRRRAVAGASDSATARLERDFLAASGRLANLTLRAGATGVVGERSAALDRARRDAEEAERALAARSTEFKRNRTRGQVGLDDVTRGLPAHSALVAYVRYDRFEHERAAADTAPGYHRRHDRPRRAEPTYMAFVLNERHEVGRVLLGGAAEIDTLISRWGREAAEGMLLRPADRAEPAYREAAEALRIKIWDPIETLVGAAERVFIVPDGGLSLVNVAALPSRDGGYLIEGGRLIHYLSAERDLVPPEAAGAGEAESRSGEGLLVAGGADFGRVNVTGALDSGRGALTASLDPPGGSAPARREPTPARGTRSGCAAFRGLRFDPLPGTSAEAQAVQALWAKHGVKVRAPSSAKTTRKERGEIASLTGAEASESAFKRLAPGRRVLHLATHGFFLGGACASEWADAPEGSDAPDDVSLVGDEENPLLLSGLALAGANQRDSADPDRDDGILTAQEIAAMNLASVDCAVLSACKTGIGEVAAGEGVVGLRRAFQIAGSRTLVMSLWSVDDQAARAWMGTLYESWLARKKPVVEAARDASLGVLRARRAQGLGTHPFFWAPFVVVGEWR